MTREKQIEILIEDRCTRKEAEWFLKNGTTVYEDFEENFDKYMEEWKSGFSDDEEYQAMVKRYKKMVETKDPIDGWGVVEMEGRTYYIEYVH